MNEPGAAGPAGPSPSPDLSGRAALVTGGGSGIGLACARHLLARGATVTICGRTAARLVDAVEDLAADAPDGAGVHHVVADVTDEEQVAAAVAAAAEPLGRLDVAVANAGSGTLGPVVATGLAEWERVLAVVLTGTFLTIKHTAPVMARSGGGSIVAVSSVAGPVTHPFMAPYSVAKAGVDTLVRNAADELGRAGVRVNAVRPGLVPTELTTVLTGDEAMVTDYLDQMPIRRLGTTDDVAAAVAFLASDLSGWITGEAISVDGGHHLRRGPDYEAMARGLYGDDAIDGAQPPQT